MEEEEEEEDEVLCWCGKVKVASMVSRGVILEGSSGRQVGMGASEGWVSALLTSTNSIMSSNNIGDEEETYDDEDDIITPRKYRWIVISTVAYTLLTPLISTSLCFLCDRSYMPLYGCKDTEIRMYIHI